MVFPQDDRDVSRSRFACFEGILDSGHVSLPGHASLPPNDDGSQTFSFESEFLGQRQSMQRASDISLRDDVTT